METTILLVEDDMDVRSLLKLELQQEHRVQEFRHGKAALDYLNEGNKPDLIITDLVMPRMDGMTFITHVRELEWGNDIPILILTGVTASDDVPAHVWKEGTSADEFLEKPLGPGELMAVVAKWLDRYGIKEIEPDPDPTHVSKDELQMIVGDLIDSEGAAFAPEEEAEATENDTEEVVDSDSEADDEEGSELPEPERIHE